MLTGELKEILIEKINKFLAIHQQKREDARSKLDEFLFKD
jgi:tryptophanyl-tRNA synthetase